MTPHSPRSLAGPLSRPRLVADFPTHLPVRLLRGPLVADPPMAGVWPQSSPRLPGFSPVAHYRPTWTRRKRNCCVISRYYASRGRKSSSGRSADDNNVLRPSVGSTRPCRHRPLQRDRLLPPCLGRWGLRQAGMSLVTPRTSQGRGTPWRLRWFSLMCQPCQGPGRKPVRYRRVLRCKVPRWFGYRRRLDWHFWVVGRRLQPERGIRYKQKRRLICHP